MNINLKILSLVIVITLSVHSNAHPFNFLGCCTKSTQQIKPMTPMKDPIELDSARLSSIKNSQIEARIQALRLIATIEHQNFIDQKKYRELEATVYERGKNLNIESFYNYISCKTYQLYMNYSIYGNSNEDLPYHIKSQYLKEKNKKQAAAQIQALRLMTIIDYPELMDTNDFSRLEAKTRIQYFDFPSSLKKQDQHPSKHHHNHDLIKYYGVYSHKNIILNNKLTQSKNNK